MDGSLEALASDSVRAGLDGCGNRSAPARLARRASAGPVDALEVRDLVALCLGGRTDRGLARASGLLARHDLASLSRLTPRYLRTESGIPLAAAARLAAAFALGRRVAESRLPERLVLRAPADVHALLAGETLGRAVETFHVLMLDGKHRLLRWQRVSEGTLTTSLVHPREVFGPALRESAAAILVAHNHPSGDPEPSAEDLTVTRRLVESGRLLGVPLLDHVVIGGGRYVSLRERISFDGA